MTTEQHHTARDLELAETWLEAVTCFQPADSLDLGDIALCLSALLGHWRIWESNPDRIRAIIEASTPTRYRPPGGSHMAVRWVESQTLGFSVDREAVAITLHDDLGHWRIWESDPDRLWDVIDSCAKT